MRVLETACNPRKYQRVMSDRWFWVADADREWVPAKLESEGSKNWTFKTFYGDEVSHPADKAKEFHEAYASSVHEDLKNLVQLEEFTEGAILHQLRERYMKDKIYTSIGTILVSINPFKQLGIYTNNILMTYKARDSTLDPHVYQTAADTFWDLMNDDENQSVIISGESGAGKTEATKLILQYLGEVAGSESGVEQQIMMSNPILEAFGNAKTLRNNNSSRFGKYMEVLFQKSGGICGAKVINYLLEKSRVVRQTPGERNYHSFYQLVTGAPPEIKDKYNVMDAKDFAYLNKSGCVEVDGIDDFQDFGSVIRAFQELKFTPKEIDNVWRALAGILHSSNLEFESVGEGSKITNESVLKQTCSIFEIDEETLSDALCFRAVTVRGEVQKIKQTASDAAIARDSLCKAIYGRIFDWLVVRINDFLCRVTTERSIGVLDIFGFEVFETNSFEQFCINYANEKLQQHFNHYIFRMEQEEYKAEGIAIDTIEFVDNQQCIDMIEDKTGIIKMLDEEVRLPRGQDQAFVEKMHEKFHRKEKNKCYGIVRTNQSVFIVNHYAGGVTYTVTGFVEKNKDNIYESLMNAAKSSKNELLDAVFNPPPTEVEAEAAASTSPGRRVKKMVSTLGSKFTKQLQELMKALNCTQPHFIRTIKPNHDKAAQSFQAGMILAQLRYAGLFEAIRVRASGFAYRKPHLKFYMRYRILLTKDQRTSLASSSDEAEKCCQILAAHSNDLPSSEIQVGKTKVFYRSSLLLQLETLRDQAMISFTILMQSAARGILAKILFSKMRALCRLAKKAVDDDDLESMEQALHQAKDSDISLFILVKVNTRVQYLKAEEAIVENLKQGIAEENLSKLEGALNRAETLDMAAQSTKQDRLALLEEGKKLKELLIKQAACRKKLKTAMVEEDIDALRGALAEAKELNMKDEDVKPAEETLERLEKELKIFNALLEAMEKRDISAIESSLEEVKTITLSSDRREKVREAVEVIVKVYCDELDAAIKDYDVMQCQTLLDKIYTSGRTKADGLKKKVSEAEDLISQKEDIRRKLAAAITHHDLSDGAALVQSIKEKGSLGKSFEDLLKQFEEMEEDINKMKALSKEILDEKDEVRALDHVGFLRQNEYTIVLKDEISKLDAFVLSLESYGSDLSKALEEKSSDSVETIQVILDAMVADNLIEIGEHFDGGYKKLPASPLLNSMLNRAVAYTQLVKNTKSRLKECLDNKDERIATELLQDLEKNELTDSMSSEVQLLREFLDRLNGWADQFEAFAKENDDDSAHALLKTIENLGYASMPTQPDFESRFQKSLERAKEVQEAAAKAKKKGSDALERKDEAVCREAYAALKAFSSTSSEVMALKNFLSSIDEYKSSLRSKMESCDLDGCSLLIDDMKEHGYDKLPNSPELDELFIKAQEFLIKAVELRQELVDVLLTKKEGDIQDAIDKVADNPLRGAVDGEVEKLEAFVQSLADYRMGIKMLLVEKDVIKVKLIVGEIEEEGLESQLKTAVKTAKAFLEEQAKEEEERLASMKKSDRKKLEKEQKAREEEIAKAEAKRRQMKEARDAKMSKEEQARREEAERRRQAAIAEIGERKLESETKQKEMDRQRQEAEAARKEREEAAKREAEEKSKELRSLEEKRQKEEDERRRKAIEEGKRRKAEAEKKLREKEEKDAENYKQRVDKTKEEIEKQRTADEASTRNRIDSMEARGNSDWADQSSSSLGTQLRSALDGKQNDQIEDLVEKIDQSDVSKNSRTFKIGRALVERIKKAKVVHLNLQKAISEMDREWMRELLEDARDLDMDDDDLVAEAKDLCYGMSDEEFRSKQFSNAREAKEMDKIVALIAMCEAAGTNAEDIAAAKEFLSEESNQKQKSSTLEFNSEGVCDMETEFNRLNGLYPLSSFPFLRATGNYAKKTLSRKQLIDNMLQWQKEPIPRSLFKLSTEYCDGKQKSKALKNDAKEIFKSVLGYMKDRFHAYPITLSHEVLYHGVENPLIRDEIYCQLIKQTTCNPSSESILLGWKLIYLCCSTFPPHSQEMRNCLFSHIAAIATPKIQRNMSFDTVENVAANAYVALKQILVSGPVDMPPSMADIKKLTEAKPLLLKIYISNGDFLEVRIASTNRDMTIERLCSIMASRLRLGEVNSELHIITEDTATDALEEYMVAPEESVVALISYWDGECSNIPSLSYRCEFCVVEDE